MIGVKNGASHSNSLTYHGGINGYDPRQYRRGFTEMQDRFFITLQVWRRRAHERGRLGALSERMLADIGISREEAERLSRKPFWKE